MTRIAALIALLVLVAPASAQDTIAERFAAAWSGTAEVPVVAATGSVAQLPALPAAVARPALKAEVTVAGDIVRIGDLIENAGAVADVAIFRAPDVGYTGSVPAGRIVEAVRAHHITGLDTRGIAEVVVTRASRAITAKDIEARIVQTLAGQYGLAAAENLTVTFDNPPRPLHVEAGAGGELRIARLTFEPRSGRFDAMLELPGSAVARRLPLRFTGLLSEAFEAVVLTRAVAPGESIKDTDVTLARRPKAEFAAGLITAADQAVGLTPKRALRPGQTIRQTDLMRPELVTRNETVTIHYEVPGLKLTMRGQALEAGAQGDIVNVLNVQSKKPLVATVVGPGQVSVSSGTRLIASAPSRSVSSSSAR